jgi:hypothetical protein
VARWAARTIGSERELSRREFDWEDTQMRAQMSLRCTIRRMRTAVPIGNNDDITVLTCMRLAVDREFAPCEWLFAALFLLNQ